MQEVIEFTTELMEDKTQAYAERQAKRKRKNDDLSKNNQNQQNKRQNNRAGPTMQAIVKGNPYAGVTKPLIVPSNGLVWPISVQSGHAEKYMEKGVPIFLAHITCKEVEDMSEVKQDLRMVECLLKNQPLSVRLSPIEDVREDEITKDCLQVLDYGHYEFQVCRLVDKQHLLLFMDLKIRSRRASEDIIGVVEERGVVCQIFPNREFRIPVTVPSGQVID
ncbi:hypothetical protein Tco_0952255 [Tanacetum coccineum]|uniref:Uncharacterized protein n=1 Tax=Tanacetum coccineum TaxID=301880 RepID=A0ABQ5DWU8_9ASTR